VRHDGRWQCYFFTNPYDRGGADIDSRVRYTSFLARTAESLGWAWTYWQFASDFIVYDIAKDDWVQPIWKALTP
jgi:endoglucanase